MSLFHTHFIVAEPQNIKYNSSLFLGHHKLIRTLTDSGAGYITLPKYHISDNFAHIMIMSLNM